MVSYAQRTYAGRLSSRHGHRVNCRASRQRPSTTRAPRIPAKSRLGRLLRGTVHDPTARRMGGVAGHAGVFSTAHDVSLYAQALLDRLAGRPSTFPLKQATLELMTTPQQPDIGPAKSRRRTMPPGTPRNDAEHDGSAARAELSGDRGTGACSVSAGISTRTFPSRAA